MFGGCAVCAIRKCAEKKNTVTVCTECDRYPCLRFKGFALVTKLFSLEKKLPHLTVKKKNLVRIDEVGKATWIAEQKKQWQCPNCKTPYSWYRSTCPTCGADLNPLKPFALDTGPGR